MISPVAIACASSAANCGRARRVGSDSRSASELAPGSDRTLCAGVAQHDTVVVAKQLRLIDDELGQPVLAGLQNVACEQDNTRIGLCCPMVELDGSPVPQAAPLGVEQH